jgi:hypothetical protein
VSPELPVQSLGLRRRRYWIAWAARGRPMAERDFLDKMVTKRTGRNPAFPQIGPGPRGTMTGPRVAGAPAVTRPCRVSRQRRCSEADALPWQGQIARATRGRDLHLNVPFPRKQPDLLMAESPPTGGLSALTGPQPPPLVARRLSSPHTPARPARYSSEATRTLPIDARGAVWDASLEDGPRPAEHQPVEPVHHGLDERESGAGRRRIRAGCRSASP